MNLGGWIFMGVSWLLIVTLTVFSMYRVLAAKEGGEEPPTATP
jgi:uncharacterized membrane protein